MEGEIAMNDGEMTRKEIEAIAIYAEKKVLKYGNGLQFEEGIEKTVRWYLDNQEWMDNVTSGDYQKYYENMYSGR